MEGTVELLAGSKVLTASIDALVVVNIVLPAVLGLIGVRETVLRSQPSVHCSSAWDMKRGVSYRASKLAIREKGKKTGMVIHAIGTSSRTIQVGYQQMGSVRKGKNVSAMWLSECRRGWHGIWAYRWRAWRCWLLRRQTLRLKNELYKENSCLIPCCLPLHFRLDCVTNFHW